MDNLIQLPSFVNPSKIQTLLIPIGNWKRKEFNKVVSDLRAKNEITLLDITPINSSLFTPQGFPNGKLFFNFNTIDNNDETNLFLYDFEPFRKTFIVIGLVNNIDIDIDSNLNDPTETLNLLKEKYSTVISHNLIYINNKNTMITTHETNDNIPNDKDNNELTHNVFNLNLQNPENEFHLETIICDIARNFLIALDRYYLSYKHVTLHSPGIIGGNTILKTTINKNIFKLDQSDDLINNSKNSNINNNNNNTNLSSANILSNGNTNISATTNNTPYNKESNTKSPSSISSSVKRLSAFEITTNSIKRSASIKIANSLSTSDSRAQQRSKGRQLKILGNFQLLTGHYLDALNSFTESADILHKIRDLLWLGSALDGIAMSFILLSYLNMSFNVPEIVKIMCPMLHSMNNANTNYNNTSIDNLNTSTNNSNNNINDDSPTKISLNKLQSPRNSVAYNPKRSLNFNSDSNFDLSIDDINLPILIKTLTNKILYYYELSLQHNTEYAPQVVYCNVILKTLTFMTHTRFSQGQLTNTELKHIISSPNINLLAEGIEDFETSTKNRNYTQFSKLKIYNYVDKLFELQLKKMSTEYQMMVYYTTSRVYNMLNYHRKEAFMLRLMLITLLNAKQKIIWHKDYKYLLSYIQELYNCNTTTNTSLINDDSNVSSAETNEVSDQWRVLQKHILQLALQVSEKFNNFMIAKDIALSMLVNYNTLLNYTEQRLLFDKTIDICIRNNFIDKYWDPNMLKKIELKKLITSDEDYFTQIPIESQSNRKDPDDLNQNKEINLQEVYNPFKQLNLKTESNENNIKRMHHTFMVGEIGEFYYTFYNPFKFDVSITALDVPNELQEYIEFESNDISVDTPFIIKPGSTGVINMPVLFKKDTNKDSIVMDSIKISVFNLAIEDFKVNNNLSNLNFESELVDLRILPEQPVLELINTSKTAGNCIMVLHGTKMRYSMKLLNKSLNCSVDYFKFTTQTNIDKSLKNDYWKNLAADKLFNLETQLEWLRTSCIKIIDAPTSLNPNEVIDFEIELDATSVPLNFDSFDLIVEYGMTTKDKSSIFVRKLKVPYEVTIRETMEVPNVDIIPLNELFSDTMTNIDWVNYLNKKLEVDRNLKINDFALLLIDFRNSWLDGISLNIEFDDFKAKEYLVESQHTLRVIVPVKKIDYKVENIGNKIIPAVIKDRQFIQQDMKKQQIHAMREQFWCNEYILDKISCQWHFSNDPATKGFIDFRKYLTNVECDIASVLYKGKLPFSINTTLSHTKVNVGDPINFKIHIEPTGTVHEPLPNISVLNILIFDNKTSKLVTHTNRRILFNGSLSRTINTQTSYQSNFELLPIEKGEYQVSVVLSDKDDKDSIIQLDSNVNIFSVE